MEIKTTNSITAFALTENQLYNNKENTPLKEASENNKEASRNLKEYASFDEVECDVYEATGARVEDVEEAAKLAEKLSINITNFGDKAFNAQANQNTETVSSLLK